MINTSRISRLLSAIVVSSGLALAALASVRKSMH